VEEVIASGGTDAATASTKVLVADCAVLAESLTVTSKVTFPETVGVPEIVPVDGAMVRPAGSLPDEMDQV
jgi:hypothetical protein